MTRWKPWQQWKEWRGSRQRQAHLARLQTAVERIGAQEKKLTTWNDDEIRERFQGLRPPGGEVPTGPALEEAFALIREACRRAVGKRPYEVQVLAGLAMAEGRIAEMATGEGKTLTAALPACLLALAGKGVHVVTVNAYLAERDCRLMEPIFNFLGLRVGLVRDQDARDRKREAYAADVSYGTGYEFGFDFLRDQLAKMQVAPTALGDRWKQRLSGGRLLDGEPVQRPLAAAVVDEIDSVLIDEAVTPLLVSRPLPPGESPLAPVYRQADTIAGTLVPGDDFEFDEKAGSIELTSAGMETIYRSKPAGFELQRAWHEYLEQALRARLSFERDVQYIVRKNAIELVDENTGRSFPDRKWRGGLHQAVEAKEGVPITPETESDVSICRQRFYHLYPFLCGMSGTVTEEAEEFRRVYDLEIVPIPRHRPLARVDLNDRIFGRDEPRLRAVVESIAERHRTGQPILIGTRTVRKSEQLSKLLAEEGLAHRVLNAKQDAEEAEIIAGAGGFGCITIATNMAGRGADIPLAAGVEALGGLHVIGVERHEGRRIDRQLIGRSGRQGDPGSSQFFLSCEDDIVKDAEHSRPGRDDEGELPASRVARVRESQRHCEYENLQRRERVMRADRWMEGLKGYLEPR